MTITLISPHAPSIKVEDPEFVGHLANGAGFLLVGGTLYFGPPDPGRATTVRPTARQSTAEGEREPSCWDAIMRLGPNDPAWGVTRPHIPDKRIREIRARGWHPRMIP